MFPTRVLAAVDGSEASRHAASEASRLCWRTGSELHMVHVAPAASALIPTESVAWYAEDVTERGWAVERAGRKLLEEQVGKVNDSGVRVEQSHLMSGRVDACIADLAEGLYVGLLVVGNRGYGGMRRALMGSVSDSLIHHAHCPVLVVRGAEKQRHGGLSAGKILVGYDGSDESQRAAEASAELATALEAELHIASVVDVSRVIPYAHPYMQTGWDKEIKQAEHEAQRLLDDVSSRLVEANNGVQITSHVLTGQPAVELVSLSDGLGVGLTIVGSRGRGGIRRALLGSVSTSVARHALGSVLVGRLTRLSPFTGCGFSLSRADHTQTPLPLNAYVRDN